MRKSAICLSCILFAFPILPAVSETITLSIVQNETAPSVALEMSQTIEDEIFGRYFDAGHIVSNTDIRFDGAKFVERNFGVKEAAFGMSDYLVAVFLSYGPGIMKDEDKKMTWAELDSVSWRLVRVRDSAVLAEASIGATNIQVTDFDPYKQSRLVADGMCDASLLAIEKAKGVRK